MTENLQEIIKSKGLKVTVQRLATLEALVSTLEHPTAEQIHDKVAKSNPTISLGTIYKTLDTLVENRLAIKVPSQDGTMRYDGNLDHHNHIFCSNTKEIVDYEDAELNQLLTEYFGKKKINNLHIEDIQVHIKGMKIDPDKGIRIS